MKIKKGKGLGIMQFKFKGLKVYSHDGGIDGFQSFALYIPEKKIGLAITFNGFTSLMMPTIIAILDTYFENDPTIKKTPSLNLNPEELNKYLGSYEGKTFPARVVFTKKGNRLFAQATGQPMFKLIATKKDYFIYDAMGIRFDFNIEEKTMELMQLI